MAYTLSNMLQDMLTKMGTFNVSEVTGGTTSTVVDSTLIGQGSDDDWNNGIMFIIRDAGGAGAAPEGEFQRISDYVDSTATFTVDTVFTAAPADGDVFGWSDRQLTKQHAIMLANEGLQLLGTIPLVDTTTLDTANNQTEYAMSVAWKYKPYRIDIQGLTGDANDNRWVTVYGWEYIPAAAGSTGLIVFDMQPTSSRDIRVWYQDVHPRINIYSDVVSELIHPELAAHAGYLAALRWMNGQRRGQESYLIERLNAAEVEFERLKAIYPIWMPASKPKYSFTRLNRENPERWKPVADI